MASQIKHKLVKNFYDALKSKISNENFSDFATRFNLLRNTANAVIWRLNLSSQFQPSIDLDVFHNYNKELIENKTVKNIFLNKCFDPVVQVEVDVKHFIKDVLESDPTEILHENPPKKIIVEFSSPNIAKPFHMGHLRSTIIGNSIANIKKKFGNDVVKMNYLGDWGTQFGLIQLGINLKNFSEEDLQKSPLQKLLEAYVKGNAEAETHPELYEEAKKIFSDLESGKEEITHSWMKYRNWTINELTAVYSRLGVTFDEYTWESDYNKKKASNVLEMIEGKRILSEDEKGRKVAVVGDKKIPLLKSDGATLYILRDLVAAVERRAKHSFDEMYYVVDNGQSDHFHLLFQLLSELNINEGVKIEHVKFGKVAGMSTRKGKIVLLSDVLNEAQDRVYQIQLNSSNTKVSLETKEVADILGVSAVIINDLLHKRLRNYEFLWEDALRMKGNTGVCLQYCHSRLCSLEEESGNKIATECDPEAFVEPSALHLITTIAKYEEALHYSNKKLEPCFLTIYLFDLIKAINSAYKELNVKNSDTHVGSQRLLMFNKSKQVLNEGMKLLGLKPLNKM